VESSTSIFPREVYLETTAAARIAEVFVRAAPDGRANVIIDTDSATATDLTLEARILPENFDGPAHGKAERVHLPKDSGKQTIAVPLPGAKGKPCGGRSAARATSPSTGRMSEFLHPRHRIPGFGSSLVFGIGYAGVRYRFRQMT